MAEDNNQLNLFGQLPTIVHYFDRNGALRSGRLIRRIHKGKKKGAFVVVDSDGHQVITLKVRNLEYL
jgi:hypothetical protein